MCVDQITIECVGVHPYLAGSGATLSEDCITPSIEAIGEIGLDFSREIDRGAQEELFCRQLEIAQRQALPVVIHSVRALDRTLQILEGFTLRAVIFHGFIGSLQWARRGVERGYFLSFGHRCFASPKTLDALRNLPITNIFFETDECDTPIEEIYHRASQYRAESLEEIRDEIYKNYKKIFNKQ